MTRWRLGKVFIRCLLLLSFSGFSCGTDSKTSSMVNREGGAGGGAASNAHGGMIASDAGSTDSGQNPPRLDALGALRDTGAVRLDATLQTLDTKADIFSPGPDLAAEVGNTDDARRDTTVGRDASGSDLQSNTSTCQPACSFPQSCVGGACVTVANAGADGCLEAMAVNLTLSQLAVYQTVKIPIMDKLLEVNRTARNADVIVGRDTLFRVFVTVGGSWVSRQLSARLTLSSKNEQSAVYFSKKNIVASSADASAINTFQIFIPASAITADTNYSLSVVECDAQSGTAEKTRFPSSGEIALGARVTGSLKIKIIPIKVDTFVPDTSSTALDIYSKMMMAMYPITKMDFTVGDTLTTTSPVNWTNMLDQLRAKRRLDAPPSDVYYYGLVKPAATLRSYCSSTCTMGIGYVPGASTTAASARVAVGTGFADKASAETMAHEVGHNHGRNHAPCIPRGGTISGVDTAFPYTNGLIGTWGYDPRTQALIDPAKSTDIMSYCNNKWISDYTYKGLTSRVALLNGASLEYTNPDIVMRYRVLIIDDSGPHWGIPFDAPGIPDGAPEEATIFDVHGMPLTQITVYRTDIGDIQASMVQVPPPEANWYAVGVKNAIPHPFAAPDSVPAPPR